MRIWELTFNCGVKRIRFAPNRRSLWARFGPLGLIQINEVVIT